MDPATLLAALSLVMSTAQTCFLAWLAARYGDIKQRVTEVQATQHQVISTIPPQRTP